MRTSYVGAAMLSVVSLGLVVQALPATPAHTAVQANEVVVWSGWLTITKDLRTADHLYGTRVHGSATYTDLTPTSIRSLAADGSGDYAAQVDVQWTDEQTDECHEGGPTEVVTSGSWQYRGSSRESAAAANGGGGYIDGSVLRLRQSESGAVYLTPWLANADVLRHHYCGGDPMLSGSSAFGFAFAQAMEADVPLLDEDPDPDRVVGTTRFAAPSGHSFTGYQFDVTYDLRRTVLEVEPCDHPSVTNRLHSTADGTSFLRAAAAPDPDFAAFGIGMRWCSRPDGAFVDRGLLTQAELSRSWVFLGALEELGFVPVERNSRVSMTQTTVRGRGTFGVKTSPVRVVMTLPPTGRLLDRAAGLLTRYDVWRKQGLSHAQAKDRLRDLLQSAADKWERGGHRLLREALDAVPGVSTTKARKWAHILGGDVYQRVGDRFVDKLVDAVVGGQTYVVKVFKRVFRRVVVPLWRVDVTLRTHPDGIARFEDRSRAILVGDQWAHRTVD